MHYGCAASSLRVKQNCLVKSITNSYTRTTKLDFLFQQLKFFKIDQISKLEKPKYIRNLNNN